ALLRRLSARLDLVGERRHGTGASKTAGGFSHVSDAENEAMKIGLFHATLPEAGRKPGGVEVAVHRLANALVLQGGDEVIVFSLTPAPADARYTHRRLFPRAAWLNQSLLGRWFLLPFLLNFVRFGAADLIHLH